MSNLGKKKLSPVWLDIRSGVTFHIFKFSYLTRTCYTVHLHIYMLIRPRLSSSTILTIFWARWCLYTTYDIGNMKHNFQISVSKKKIEISKTNKSTISRRQPYCTRQYSDHGLSVKLSQEFIDIECWKITKWTIIVVATYIGKYINILEDDASTPIRRDWLGVE